MPTTPSKPTTIVLQAPPETLGQRMARELLVAVLAGLVIRVLTRKSR